MAQFDVYLNEESESKTFIPFLLDVQHDLHSGLLTRSVVPLVVISSPKDVVEKLCPCFNIAGKDVYMSTPEVAGYPVADLQSKIGSLKDSRNEVLAAIDFLLNGF